MPKKKRNTYNTAGGTSQRIGKKADSFRGVKAVIDRACDDFFRRRGMATDGEQYLYVHKRMPLPSHVTANRAVAETRMQASLKVIETRSQHASAVKAATT